MKEDFLKSNFLFLLLRDQGYYLPKYDRENFSSEYGISGEDFVNQYNEEAMEDIKVCLDEMSIESKKDLIASVIKRIDSEKEYLTNLKIGVIELGIEINKEARKECE